MNRKEIKTAKDIYNNMTEEQQDFMRYQFEEMEPLRTSNGSFKISFWSHILKSQN